MEASQEFEGEEVGQTHLCLYTADLLVVLSRVVHSSLAAHGCAFEIVFVCFHAPFERACNFAFNCTVRYGGVGGLRGVQSHHQCRMQCAIH